MKILGFFSPAPTETGFSGTNQEDKGKEVKRRAMEMNGGLNQGVPSNFAVNNDLISNILIKCHDEMILRTL